MPLLSHYAVTTGLADTAHIIHHTGGTLRTATDIASRINPHLQSPRHEMITTPILIAETLAIIILAVALAHDNNQ